MSVSKRVEKFHDSMRLDEKKEKERKRAEKERRYELAIAQEKEILNKKIKEIKQIIEDPNEELDKPRVYEVYLSDSDWNKDRTKKTSHRLVAMTERIKRVAEAIQDSHFIDGFGTIRYSLNNTIYNGGKYNAYYSKEYVHYKKINISPYEGSISEGLQKEIDIANKIIEIIKSSTKRELSKKCILTIFNDDQEQIYTRSFEINTTEKAAELLRLFNYIKQNTRVEPIKWTEEVRAKIDKMVNGERY